MHVVGGQTWTGAGGCGPPGHTAHDPVAAAGSTDTGSATVRHLSARAWRVKVMTRNSLLATVKNVTVRINILHVLVGRSAVGLAAIG